LKENEFNILEGLVIDNKGNEKNVGDTVEITLQIDDDMPVKSSGDIEGGNMELPEAEKIQEKEEEKGPGEGPEEGQEEEELKEEELKEDELRGGAPPAASPGESIRETEEETGDKPTVDSTEESPGESTEKAAFDYRLEDAPCDHHEICVEDVRDVCVARRMLRYCIPCLAGGISGCRGGFLPDGLPEVRSWRVLCAEERLSPATGCDRIINEIEFEVVLKYGSTLVVVTPRDVFECLWHEFARFPGGQFYPDNREGLEQFRNELRYIDGSCKVIIVENVRVVAEGNDCILVIEYKAVDKLWKHENLLVYAIRPYKDNITIKQEFDRGHKTGACAGNGPRGGI